jgi:hypothetical protein
LCGEPPGERVGVVVLEGGYPVAEDGAAGDAFINLPSLLAWSFFAYTTAAAITDTKHKNNSRHTSAKRDLLFIPCLLKSRGQLADQGGLSAFRVPMFEFFRFRLLVTDFSGEFGTVLFGDFGDVAVLCVGSFGQYDEDVGHVGFVCEGSVVPYAGVQ